MALAIVGFIGLAFFSEHPPGKGPLHRVLGQQLVAVARRAADVHLDGRDPLPHEPLARDVRRPRPWLNRVPGRLMHVNILGCGIFGSVSGSSAATCATISKVALPELLKRGYDERVALGSLATAGRWDPHPALDHDGGLRGRRGRLDHPRVPRGVHPGASS
jgi:hypothetical protein